MGDLVFLGLVVLAYLLAGVVKGVIGMGLPTVALAVLALVTTPAQAAALLVAPSLVTNVWQMVAGPHLRTLVRRLGAMLAGAAVGAWITSGAGILTGENATLAATALGLALVAYALLGLSGVRFKVAPTAEKWVAPLVGLATGVLTAATGVFVLPALPYMQAIGLDKDELVQALGLHFTFCTLLLAAILVHDGAFGVSLAAASLVAVAPALVGMLLGQRVRRRIRVEVFRLCLFLGLLAVGGHLVLRNAF